jgi:hypothetical protein
MSIADNFDVIAQHLTDRAVAAIQKKAVDPWKQFKTRQCPGLGFLVSEALEGKVRLQGKNKAHAANCDYCRGMIAEAKSLDSLLERGEKLPSL